MIKVGDKVICIKVHYGFLSKYTHKENKIYEVLRISGDECSVFVNDEQNEGIWFTIIDNVEYMNYQYKFCDYFISIAELREQQIKSVIDG
jgi:hypothetical protein